jgi:hypothetical protein
MRIIQSIVNNGPWKWVATTLLSNDLIDLRRLVDGGIVESGSLLQLESVLANVLLLQIYEVDLTTRTSYS